MKRIIGSLFVILALAMFVMACGDDKESLTCGDGEIKARIKVGGVEGEEKCYKTCDTTADCPSPGTQECRGATKICRDKEVVGNNNNNNNNNNNLPVETPTISEEHKTLCEDFCELTLGCIYDWCLGERPAGVIQECMTGRASEPDDTGCFGDLTGTSADAAKIEAAAEEMKELVYRKDGSKAQCDDRDYERCAHANLNDMACGCIESKTVGDACEKEEDCGGGTLPAACIPEKDDKDKETGFEGGYCIAQACDIEIPMAKRIPGSANPNSRGCGEGNYCLMERYENSAVGSCFPGCEKQENCRTGYSCTAGGSIVEIDDDGKITKETMAKICLPATCKADSDCGSGENQGRCIVETGACQIQCNDAKATEYCESGGGSCEEDGDKKYCVLE